MNERSTAGGDTLPEAASVMGPIALVVHDLQRVVEFYREGLGLRVQRSPRSVVAMGAGGEDLIVLEERRDSPLPPPDATGLFHLAILLPSRAALAAQIDHLYHDEVPVGGMADHHVSEAVYLADPEGNGIEIYSDRPRKTWAGLDGTIQMPTEPLDVMSIMSERPPGAAWEGMPAETVIGHVHLRVSDLAAAETFYRETVGLEVTARYGKSATFMSFGGYHHHIGLNTWQSRGGPAPPEGALGLEHFEIRPPRVQNNEPGGSLKLRDPSGNHLLLRRG